MFAKHDYPLGVCEGLLLHCSADLLIFWEKYRNLELSKYSPIQSANSILFIIYCRNCCWPAIFCSKGFFHRNKTWMKSPAKFIANFLELVWPFGQKYPPLIVHLSLFRTLQPTVLRNVSAFVGYSEDYTRRPLKLKLQKGLAKNHQEMHR